MAKALEARLEELVQVIHPHPTLSEAVRKAMLEAMGRKASPVRWGPPLDN